MSHNTFRGMAVLALGMTSSVAFGQETSLDAAAGADASVGTNTNAAASAETTTTGAAAEPGAPYAAPAAPTPSAPSAETATAAAAVEPGTAYAAETAPAPGAPIAADAYAPPTSSDRWLEQLLPVDGMTELGIAIGLLTPSSRHNFQLENRPHQEIGPTGEVAVRGAWLPIRFVGVEAEGAAGASETEDGAGAYPWSLRLSALGQLPLWRITPFALLGFGRMGNVSNAMGSDGDPMFHFGFGAKAFLTELIAVRVDLRDSLTQRHGSSDGMLTHSFDLLLGASVTLGRPAPPAPACAPAPGG